MSTTRLPPVLCPHCGYLMDNHTKALGSKELTKPRPGDIGICFECMSPLVFDENLRLREACDEELGSLPQELLERLIVAKMMKRHLDRKFRVEPSGETRQ